MGNVSKADRVVGIGEFKGRFDMHAVHDGVHASVGVGDNQGNHVGCVIDAVGIHRVGRSGGLSGLEGPQPGGNDGAGGG